ncbi:MAG: hypothetical protein KDJ18_11390 [Hyphomicrobiaceae bacterium]|nr:hypothetical protein [Hyphomicrobiaceae bacterium]
MTTKTRITASLALLPVIALGTTPSAIAKETCVFMATNGSGAVVQGVGTHRKNHGKACNRAAKECNKKLKKAGMPRGRETPVCRPWQTF